MRILQIGLGNNPGGAETFVMNYYRELVKQGVQFDFVCMYERIAYEEEIEALGGEIFYIPNVKKNYFGYVKGLKKVLKPEKYQAVHVHMFSAANIVPLRLAYAAGMAKVIAHSHNSSAPGFLRGVMDSLNRPKIRRYAVQKFACGEISGRWLFGDRAYDSGEVQLVRNAVNVDKYLFSAQTRLTLRGLMGWEDKFVIGHVGRFDVQKNHEGLVRIFQEIARENPQARLCLVGDGVLMEHIGQAVERAGLAEKVFFAGVRPDVENFLCAMDVFLFPSLSEGLPFTLVEAQASGLPCVVSDVITEEAFLPGDQVTSLPLKADAALWAEAVQNYSGRPRKSGEILKKELAEAHFDILREALRLKYLYQE